MSNVAVPSYRQRIGYHAMLLGVVALITSAMLVIGNLQTHDTIALRLKEDMQVSLRQVIPASLYNNDPLEDTVVIKHNDVSVLVYRARKQHQIVAVAFEVTGIGYAGPIKLIIGIDTKGKVIGTRVITHSETPGLGDKIEIARDDWIDSFNGKSLINPPSDKWKVKKDGGIYDQFTGATITPRAVVKAVKLGLEFFQQHHYEIMASEEPISTSLNNMPMLTQPNMSILI